MGNQYLEWFEVWFNTSYYHILYKNRDNQEALGFINSLIQYLQPKEDSYFLDLACGKGRHSVTINELGYKVTGVDLAERSILEAKEYENETLNFAIHDMREVYKENAFDYVFNIFTSFGYFDDTEENILVLEAVHKMLKKEGKLVIDFMNVDFVLQHLVEEEIKTIDGIEFHITREYDGTFIYKNISFEDKGKQYKYQEKVQAIKKQELESMLKQSNFKIVAIFGDIKLSPFERMESDRLIIIAEKE